MNILQTKACILNTVMMAEHVGVYYDVRNKYKAKHPAMIQMRKEMTSDIIISKYCTLSLHGTQAWSAQPLEQFSSISTSTALLHNKHLLIVHFFQQCINSAFQMKCQLPALYCPAQTDCFYSEKQEQTGGPVSIKEHREPLSAVNSISNIAECLISK